MIDTVEITTQAQPNEQVIEQKKEAAPSSLWRRLALAGPGSGALCWPIGPDA